MAWQTDEAIEELFSKETVEEEREKILSNKKAIKKNITSSSSSNEARLRSVGRRDYESYMI